VKKTADITAGEFRFPVEVQRPSYTDDGSGGQNKTWPTVIPVVFCAVENRQGSEPYGDKDKGRIRTFQTFSFTTWWRDDIQVTDRLLFQGTLFNIRRINNLDLRNKFLQIIADSGVEQ
jgi:SPP1 family predicted phage head-tail adaptor